VCAQRLERRRTKKKTREPGFARCNHRLTKEGFEEKKKNCPEKGVLAVGKNFSYGKKSIITAGKLQKDVVSKQRRENFIWGKSTVGYSQKKGLALSSGGKEWGKFTLVGKPKE